MVGFCRVKPPRIHAQVEHVALHLSPVQVAGYGVERVVRLDPGVPWPRLEVVKGPNAVHPVVHVGPRAERSPHRNHYVRVLLVHIVNHLLGCLDARLRPRGVCLLAFGQETHIVRVAHLVDVTRVFKAHRVPV